MNKTKVPAYMKYAKNFPISWNDPTVLLKPSDLSKPLIDIVADDYPMIIEYNNIEDNSYQINSIVEKESPLFQPSPKIVVFKDYSPYTIHEQKICFRNNDSVARRLKIIQPDSVFFDVSAIKLINGEPLNITSKIASGMEVCVIIKFKPQEVRDYSIDLIISTEREKFIVPIRAVGLRPFLVIPDEIDFGVCPIKTPTRKSILVQNTGQAVAHFIITSKTNIFTCPSEEITIDINGSKMIEFYFIPKTTLMSISEFEISFIKGPKCYIKLIGSGKNVDVNISTNNLILDSCYISLFSEKSIMINNNSNLPIQFAWKSFSVDIDDENERNKMLNDINDLEKRELNDLYDKVKNGEYNLLGNMIDSPSNTQLESKIDVEVESDLPLLAKADEAAIIRKYRNLRQEAMKDKLLFIDSIFELTPTEGTIWANSSLEISIAFRPDTAALFNCIAYLDISGRQDRIPLHLSGTGIGPHAVLSFEQLDIGDIFINQTQNFSLQMVNKGDIPAVYNYVPTNLTKFSNSFEFFPSSGVISPGNTETLGISFLSTILGEFHEKFLFSLQGNEELLSCSIKGHVIGPTFHFSCRSINYNIVSYDYLHTQVVRLTNTSTIDMNFYLYIPQDNGIKKEFNIEPNQGVLQSQQYIDIYIEFIPISVKIFNYSLNIDVIGVGNNLSSVPIYAECRIGSLQLHPRDLDFGECFIRYPYYKKVNITNLSNEVNTKFEFLPQFQYTKSIGSYEVEPSVAVIEPNDTMFISMKLVGLRLGVNKIPYQIAVSGSTEPPIQGSIIFTAIGPRITTNVTELRYGNIECLKDIFLPLIITNESLITASMKIFLKMARSKYSIKDNIYDLVLQANESKTIDIIANLDDTIICKDELHIIVEEGDDIMIPLSSKGIGTTIYSGIDLKNIDLGIQLTNQSFEKAIFLENKGKRQQFLKWTNLSVTTENNLRLQELKKLNKKEKLLKIPKNLLPIESIYTIYPMEITLRPRTAISFVLKGFSSTPGQFSETFQLESRIGKERTLKQITETVVSTTIVNPLLSISESDVSFNYTWSKGVEPIIQSKNITLTNLIDIPITFVLRTEVPFHLSSWEHTLHPNQSIDITIFFDPLYKDNKESHIVKKNIAISYKNHPQIDYVTLQGEINFPNLAFNKKSPINFGVILNNTTKTLHIELSNNGKVIVNYEWILIDMFSNKRITLKGTRENKNENNIPIDQVIDILPIRSTILPSANEIVEISMVGSINNKFQGTLICQVEGGPEYSFQLQGESSYVSYQLDKYIINYGRVYYNDSFDQEITILNNGKVNFSFSFSFHTNFCKEILEILPSTGTVAMNQSIKVILRLYPSYPQYIYDHIFLHIGHFDPVPIYIFCQGIHQSITLTLPRYKRFDPLDINQITSTIQLLDPLSIKEIWNDFDDKVYNNIYKYKVIDKYVNTLTNSTISSSTANPPEFIENIPIDKVLVNLLNDSIDSDIMKEIDKLKEINKKVNNNIALVDIEMQRLVLYNIIISKLTKYQIENNNFSSLKITEKNEKINDKMKKSERSDRTVVSYGIQNIIMNKLGIDTINLGNYYIDFGNIIYGQTKRRYFKLTNTSINTALSFTIDTKSIISYGYTVEPTQINKLKENESIDLMVKYFAKTNQKSGKKISYLPIYFSKGLPYVNLVFSVNVCMPDIELSTELIDFNSLEIGRSKTMYMTLHNPSPVVTNWTMKRILTNNNVITYQSNNFIISPMEGSLKPGKKEIICIEFIPNESKKYLHEYQIKIENNPKLKSFHIVGEGAYLPIKINPNNITMGPIMPYEIDEKIITITNPNDEDIEIYSIDYDKQYINEELILSTIITKYDSLGFIRSDIRLPGKGLDIDIINTYTKLNNQYPKVEESKLDNSTDKPVDVPTYLTIPNIPNNPSNPRILNQQQDILVFGPPMSGISILSKRLSSKLNLPLYTIDKLIDDVLLSDSFTGKIGRRMFNKSTSKEVEEINSEISNLTIDKDKSIDVAIEGYKKSIKKKKIDIKDIPSEVLRTPEVIKYEQYLSDANVSVDKLIDILTYRLTWNDLSYGIILDFNPSYYLTSYLSSYLSVQQAFDIILKVFPTLIVCNLTLTIDYNVFIDKLYQKKVNDSVSYNKDINDVQRVINKLNSKTVNKNNNTILSSPSKDYLDEGNKIEECLPSGDESWYNETNDSITELDSQDIKSLDESMKLLYYQQLLYYKYKLLLNIKIDIQMIKDINPLVDKTTNAKIDEQSDVPIDNKVENELDTQGDNNINNNINNQVYTFDKYLEIIPLIENLRNINKVEDVDPSENEDQENQNQSKLVISIVDIPIDINDNDDDIYSNAMILLPAPKVKQPEKDTIPSSKIYQINKRLSNRINKKINKFLSIHRAKTVFVDTIDTEVDLSLNTKAVKGKSPKEGKSSQRGSVSTSRLNSPRNETKLDSLKDNKKDNKKDSKADNNIDIKTINSTDSLESLETRETKIIVDDSISIDDPNYYRWIIPSKQSINIIVKYTVPYENKVDNTLGFEVVGTMQLFNINIVGTCDIPNIINDPRNIFMRRIKVFPIIYPLDSQIYEKVDNKNENKIDTKIDSKSDSNKSNRRSSKIEIKRDSTIDSKIDLSACFTSLPPDRKYILNQNIYSFGALGIYKPFTYLSIVKSPESANTLNMSTEEITCISTSITNNMDIIRLTNKGHFTATIDIYLENLSAEMTNIFTIEPSSIILDVNESKDVSIYSFPKECKIYVNKMIICIKNNPIPLVYPIMCIGTSVNLQFLGSWDQTIKEAEEFLSTCKDKKLIKDLEIKIKQLKENLPIDFSRILINKQVNKSMTLVSNSLVPIAWKIDLQDLLNDEYVTISPLSGVLEPNQSIDISIFIDCRDIMIINKKFNVLFSDNEGGLSYPSFNRIQSKSFQVIAEVYNIQAISLSTNSQSNPLSNQQLLTSDSYLSTNVDFGVLRVGDIATSIIKLGNKGKYKIKYNIILNNHIERYITIDTKEGFIEPINAGSKDPYSQSIQDIAITIQSNENELILKNNNDIVIQIIEPLNNEIVETFPITINSTILYNKFRISPSKCLNFGAIRYIDPSNSSNNSANPTALKSIELRNEGIFSFSYVIVSSILEYDEIDLLDNNSLSVYAYNVPPGRRIKELGDNYMTKLKKKPTSATNKKHKQTTSYLLNNPLVYDPDGLTFEKVPNDPLVVGAYTVTPRIGVVEPGQRVTIDVLFNPLVCEVIKEKLRICISGIDPKDSYSSSIKSFDIIGECCLPAIVTNEPKSIFEEQEIVQTLDSVSNIPVGKVVYAINEKILGFGPMLCNISPTDYNKNVFERIKIINPTKIDIKVKFSVTSIDNLNRSITPKEQSKSKQPIPKDNKELSTYLGFIIYPSSWDIPPHEYRYINIYFNPIEMKLYKALLKCEVDYDSISIESNNSLTNGKLLSFQLQGLGTLPCITIDEPTERLPNGNLLIDYGKLHIDKQIDKNIVLRNNGILPTTCQFEFYGDNCNEFDFSYVDRSITIEPSGIFQLLVSFSPKGDNDALGDKNATIKLSILQNTYDNYTINLRGYSYALDATIDTISLQSDNSIYPVVSDQINFPDIILSNDINISTYKVLLKSRCYLPLRFQLSNNSDMITFKPTIGHLLPYTNKEILITFTTNKPVKLDQIFTYITLKRIEFITNETDTKIDRFENGWDDSYFIKRVITEDDKLILANYQTLLIDYQNKYEAAVKSKNKKALQALGNQPDPCKIRLGEIDKNNDQLIYEVLDEPKFNEIVDNSGTNNNQLSIPCYGIADNIKISCNTTEIKYPDTYIYQSNSYTIEYNNDCSLLLLVRWKFVNRNQRKNSVIANAPIGISRGLGLLDREPSNPFSIEPNDSVVKPNSKTQFVIRFTPLDADNYNYELIGSIDNIEGNTVNIILSGSSLRPIYHFDISSILSSDYLSTRSNNLKNENGIVSPIELTSLKVIKVTSTGINTSNLLKFKLINPSNNNYNYLWESIGESSMYWKIITSSGNLLSNSNCDIIFEYTPNDIIISEQFLKFSIPSYNIIEYFLLVGNVIEPNISFNTSKIDFNQILLNNKLSSTMNSMINQEIIYIYNNESISYQFNFDKSSFNSNILSINPLSGSVLPNSKLPIVISFNPVEETIYNYNVICNIKCKPNKLIINVKGEGYNVHPSIMIENTIVDDTNKFIPLKSKPSVNIVDFGIVQLQDKITKIIKMSNQGKYGFDYTWDISNLSSYFQFNGELNGILNKSQEIIYSLTYLPIKKEIIPQSNVIYLNISNKYYYKICIQGSSIAPLIKFSFISYDFNLCYITSPGGQLMKEEVLLNITNNDLNNNISLECLFAKTRALWIDNYQPTVLEPGQSITLTINFAPREVKDYQFVIPFLINNLNKYNINIKGKGIPTRVELVDTSNYNLNFGIINTNQNKTKSFDIINRGKKIIDIELIDMDGILANEFGITYLPLNKFQLKPKGIKTIDIIFNPMNKRIPLFNNDLYISYGGIERSLVKISGKAQGVDIALDTDILSFGIVVQGSKKSKKLLLENKGDISIQYQWDNNTFGKHFTISPLIGKLSPGNEVSFDVIFEPKVIDDDIRQDDIVLRILGQANPLLLTCNGLCIAQPKDMITTISFESKARKAEVKTVKLSNNTDKDWYLSPLLDGEHWIIPNDIKVPLKSSIDLPITYYPLTMSKQSTRIPSSTNLSTNTSNKSSNKKNVEKAIEVDLIPQEGQIFISLPDGNVLLYNLLGYSHPPESSGLITIETPAKVPISKSISITNWLSNKSQELVIKVDIMEMPSAATSVICFNVIDLAPGMTKDLPIRFQSYCEGTTKGKITLTNELTGEYIYYDIIAKTTMSDIIDTITIDSPIRQITRYIINIENPLPIYQSINMLENWYSCDNPCVQLVELTPLSNNHEGIYEIQYRPLTLSNTTSLLSIYTKELGTFKYKLILSTQSSTYHQTLRFQDISLGSLSVDYIPIVVYNKTKTEYTCTIKNYPSIFNVNKSLIVDGINNFNGEVINVKVTYDPITIGELQDTLIISSPDCGEYIIDIISNCISPIPQGPINFSYVPNNGKATTGTIGINLQEITFRNCFTSNLIWNIICDNNNYKIIINSKDQVKDQSKDQLKDNISSMSIPSKIDGKFSILFDPSNDDMNQAINKDGIINGKIMITCPSKPELLPWIYYLRGNVNREQTPLTPTRKK